MRRWREETRGGRDARHGRVDDDKTNRGCLAGRYRSQFIEIKFDDNYFTLRGLTLMADRFVAGTSKGRAWAGG